MADDGLNVRQYAHIIELDVMNTEAAKVNQTELRSQSGKLLYITQTSKPLYAYAAARLSQVKPDQADSDDVTAFK